MFVSVREILTAETCGRLNVYIHIIIIIIHPPRRGPGSRSGVATKAVVALAAFWTERHSVQGPPASFFSPFEEVFDFLTL